MFMYFFKGGISSLSRILVAAQILREFPQRAEPFPPNQTAVNVQFIDSVSDCTVVGYISIVV